MQSIVWVVPTMRWLRHEHRQCFGVEDACNAIYRDASEERLDVWLASASLAVPLMCVGVAVVGLRRGWSYWGARTIAAAMLVPGALALLAWLEPDHSTGRAMAWTTNGLVAAAVGFGAVRGAPEGVRGTEADSLSTAEA
jgi:hypothetical protein